MYQKRENLDIIFRQVTPEYIMNKLDKVFQGKEDGDKFFDFVHYDHFARMNLSQLSQSELELRYKFMKASNKIDIDIFLFVGLYQYADKVLVSNKGIPLVRLDKCLAWNSITSRLGQDIFTTAWLAWKDVEDRNEQKRFFDWPAVLKTNDKRLNNMLKKGLAENHYHLHGSTQSFSLSWACMMNHPDYIDSFFGNNFQENLNASISLGEMDNTGSWNARIKCAAMIRALLFARCLRLLEPGELLNAYHNSQSIPLWESIKECTESLRNFQGEKFVQQNGKRKCLDYAISSEFYEVDENNDSRFLAGERNFLYQSFRRVFSKELTWDETLLFYLYLVIKSNFRSEIIQVNERYGFENFSAYQDRKSQFFEMFPEYKTEALRLSVCAAIKENHLVSLEGRIMPKKSAKLMEQTIDSLDRTVKFSELKEADREKIMLSEVGTAGKMTLPFYYTIHFPKKKFEDKEFIHAQRLVPRNYPTRKKAEKCAKALVRYILHCDNKEDRRVKGIDACSLEIGCRPETFATEFRYIRRSIREKTGRQADDIGITYHVGEDFLDITDGLRAIDETIRFLELDKGDRLGHAIVLGIEPLDYYQLKRNIFWTKQDYLDNVIWLLYRSAELNVGIVRNDRAVLKEEAERLIRELYLDRMKKKASGNILDLYYRSWKLRGDHPSLYQSGKYRPIDDMCIDCYKNCMVSDGKRDFDRNEKIIAEFYYRYHYDKDTKKAGLEAKEFLVKDWYIKLMRDMQKAIRQDLFQRRIAIECNPTSNVKIGTFRMYDRHPLLTFNNHLLEDDNATPNMKVSINTDDLGVFDTSLANEYALLFDALKKKRHMEGNYNDDAVYDYLNYVRKTGLEMAFKKL